MIHDFFKFIFYFIGVLPLIWEIAVVFEIKKIHRYIKVMDITDRKDFTFYQRSLSVLNFLYIGWVFMGLFSSQWILFLAIIVFNFIPKNNIIVRWVDALLSCFVLLFIILNVYHFKIDLLSLIKSFL